jgi:hypothetical protein
VNKKSALSEELKVLMDMTSTTLLANSISDSLWPLRKQHRKGSMEQSEFRPTRAEFRHETSEGENLLREDYSIRYRPDDTARHRYSIRTEAFDGGI